MSESARTGRFLGLSRDAWMYTLLGVGALLTTIDFILAFLFAPVVVGAGVGGTAIVNGVAVSNQLLFSQKIFYFHVPVAISSFLIFFFTAYYGVRFLMTKDKEYDTKAKIATEVTLLFVILTLITGDLWTRFEWGAWWVWEPRLTTYFIMMLLVIAYFVLRNSIEDEERRATYAAVFGIIAFLDAPISFADHAAHPELRAPGRASERRRPDRRAALGVSHRTVRHADDRVGDLPVPRARGVREGAPRGAQGRPRRLDVAERTRRWTPFLSRSTGP